MIEYRTFQEKDFLSVQKLYKRSFNLDMSKDYYDYFYLNNEGEYFSYVALDGEEVIAHNALIERNYFFKEGVKKVALSSGGMVDVDFSGVFYPLLRKQIKNFEGDMIIAFPNKNSAPFFSKILKFQILEDNYFTLNASDFCQTNIESVNKIHRDIDFIKWRIDSHPHNSYVKIEKGLDLFIYKQYMNEIDIIYSSRFDMFFEEQIQGLINKGYKKFNIIHWDSNYIQKLGFKLGKNNIFVTKGMKGESGDDFFQCQMIDSDVF